MATHRHRLMQGHQIRLLQGGQDFFPALVDAIGQARAQVHLETYIFDFTGVGDQVARSLMAAAERGVRVRVVVDGVGTGPLPEAWREAFDRAGVHWMVYSPLGALGLALPSRWRRLHRKLCVVDGRLAFCGGINILDDFHDPHHGPLPVPRLDFAVCARGALVAEVESTLIRLWQRMQVVQGLRARRYPEVLREVREMGLRDWLADPRPVPPPGASDVRAGLLLRDNLRNRTRIERAYLQAIGRARREILIANAYFLPGRRLRRALLAAARRGVRVRLLLQGRYEYFMQYHAARPVYGLLLKAGVEIHEYTDSFLHAKVAVIDADGDSPWATVGSSNLDPLSLLLAREANVEVIDGPFARELRARIARAIEQGSDAVDPQVLAARPWRQRLLDQIAFALMRMALFLAGRRY